MTDHRPTPVEVAHRYGFKVGDTIKAIQFNSSISLYRLTCFGEEQVLGKQIFDDREGAELYICLGVEFYEWELYDRRQTPRDRS